MNSGNLLGELREAVQHLQVFVDLRFDPRVLHLDDDPLARLQPGAVDLADRGRGDRRQLELGKQLVQRLAQLRLDRLANDLRRIGGRRRLELLQLVGQLLADQVGPGAQQLAELDERRPQLGERQADSRFARQAGQRLAVAVLQAGP